MQFGRGFQKEFSAQQWFTNWRCKTQCAWARSRYSASEIEKWQSSPN